MSAKKTDLTRIAMLIAGYLRGTLNEEERRELEEWQAKEPGNRDAFREMTDPQQTSRALDEMRQYSRETAFRRITDESGDQPVHRLRARNRWWIPAAASLLVLLATVSAFFLLGKKKALHTYEGSALARVGYAPASEQVLLSTNGDNAVTLKEGERPRNSMVSYNRDDGWVFLPTRKRGWVVLNTGKGQTCRVVLPDGTRIWMNAAASLRFSAGFGGERKVYMDGEAFFDVAHDPSRPFRVSCHEVEVRALGTRFDVNATGGKVITTLLSGRVAVLSGKDSLLLTPGNGITSVSGQGMGISPADTSLVQGWRQGEFRFSRTPLTEAMEQIGKWYDVKMTISGNAGRRKTLTGDLPNTIPLGELLAMIEQMKIARFRVTGRDVTVL